MNIKALLLMLSITVASAVWSQTLSNAKTFFHDNDTICYVGNSITHSGYYHSLIDAFYLTRYPAYNLKTYNCGISGDNIDLVLKRFDKDIASKHPSLVTVKLGTNDIERSLYDYVDSNQRRKNIVDSLYRVNLLKLAFKIDSIGARIVFFTPAYYEELSDVNNITKVKYGLNEKFKIYSNIISEVAKRYKYPVVDFHYYMDSVTKLKQVLNKKFTLIKPDRIHPEYDGHFVMAFAYFNSLNVSPYISKLNLSVKSVRKLETFNLKVISKTINENEVRIKYIEKSLPFPRQLYPKDTTLIDFTNRYNMEEVIISGLNASVEYSLYFDNVFIQKFTGKELQQGINIAMLANAPQVIQANALAAIIEKRRMLTSQIRDLKFVEYRYAPVLKDSIDIANRLNAILQQQVGAETYKYLNAQFNNYIKNFNNENFRLVQIDSLTKEIYKLKWPKIHSLTIKQ